MRPLAGTWGTLARDEHTGRKVGGREILCSLSVGGMSQLFLALEKGSGSARRVVVLKQVQGDELAEQMFLEEARIVACLSHPNIAQVFDLWLEGGALTLALEFVAGATLFELAVVCYQRRVRLPPAFALTVARDTALALHHAHTARDPSGRQLRVVHRDVSHKNIMMSFSGVTKLLDFGIAKSTSARSFTQVGVVRGTSGYITPEQLCGMPAEPRSDVYSLGVVLHEALTGKLLFRHQMVLDQRVQNLMRRVPPPSRANPQIPEEIDELVLRAVRPNPNERYATAADFARAIERNSSFALWDTEQCGRFVQDLFSERLAATRLLVTKAATGVELGEEEEVTKSGLLFQSSMLEVVSSGEIEALQEDSVHIARAEWIEASAAISESTQVVTAPEALRSAVSKPVSLVKVKKPPARRTRFRWWVALAAAVALLAWERPDWAHAVREAVDFWVARVEPYLPR